MENKAFFSFYHKSVDCCCVQGAHLVTRHWAGLLVLVLTWSPGLLAVVHMLAFHRRGYVQQCRHTDCPSLCPAQHRARRNRFFLKLVLIVLFYPLVPALSYARYLQILQAFCCIEVRY